MADITNLMKTMGYEFYLSTKKHSTMKYGTYMHKSFILHPPLVGKLGNVCGFALAWFPNSINTDLL